MPAPQATGASPPATSPSAPPPGPLGKFLSYLRGDRYLVGAYPPEWQEPVKAGTATAGPPVSRDAATAEPPAAPVVPIAVGSAPR
jgi:hypothetical protein